MMFVGKGTPTPGVPLVSLYPDFDKKATAFFVEVYVLFAHFAVKRPDVEEFVNSAGNSGAFLENLMAFAYLTTGVIRAVIGKTFQPPVQNSGAKWWKSGWGRDFSTLSTEFSTMENCKTSTKRIKDAATPNPKWCLHF